ncbi:MAG: bifunctional 5,10-methylenetetrahydrofolate dehydrogenase/5,10-methenyltetrahydrofolate cyclohydrolase [Actinobacteria bacterium]|nr:bifunctional 5,10-methylenetetrahydrofolate dehydrogenase/5,10-methenyltetrahydrofolate cyclohydrolase [Actinomycetota bacterium]
MDGRRIAADLQQRLSTAVAGVLAHGVRPGLATVLAGDDYAARAYERRVRRLAGELGCGYTSTSLPGTVDEADAVATVGALSADPAVHGILVLRPLPDGVGEAALHAALDPAKDVEAVHPLNVGLLTLGRPRHVPSTPAACFEMLDRYLVDTGRDPAEFYPRRTIAVVGRSANVGRPAVMLGLARDATVVSCDEHTDRAGRLADYTRDADVLITAAGVPGLVRGEHVRDGVIAIDVGINPVPDAAGGVRLVGDLDHDSVADRAEALSPVPGGVGPITDVCLLGNVVAAARALLCEPHPLRSPA